MSTPSLTRRLWLAFALMAALTLLSTVIGWISLRVISQVEQTNTQALLPTMNMARQLSEASAYELFSAQNLTNADSEGVWLAQGKMLKAQSLKINHLLQALSEQGFNTSAIARQEKEIAQTLGQQGTLVGEILTLRAQQQQLSRQIAEARKALPPRLTVRPIMQRHLRAPPRPVFTILSKAVKGIRLNARLTD